MKFRIPKSKGERARWLGIFRKDEALLQQKLKERRLRIWMLEAEENGWGCTAMRGEEKPQTCRFFKQDDTRGSGCAHQPKPGPDSPADGIVVCVPVVEYLKGLENDGIPKCPAKFS